MPEINFTEILTNSIALAKKELGTAFKTLKPFAEHEITQFAENAAFLAKLKIQGTIDDNELKSRLQIQKLAFANVLLAIKGIGLLTAQSVVNGILEIVAKALKSALNIAIPV